MAKTIVVPKDDADKLENFTEDDLEVLRELEQSLQDVMDGNVEIV